MENLIASAERGFSSILSRLTLIGAHIAATIQHPRTPEPLREALPQLMLVLEDIRQELAELRRPCPCEDPGAALVQALGVDLNDPAARAEFLAVVAKLHEHAGQELKQLQQDEAMAKPLTGEEVAAHLASEAAAIESQQQAQ